MSYSANGGCTVCGIHFAYHITPCEGESSMTDITDTLSALERAQQLGAEHGRTAGESRFDGNTSVDDYRACIEMDAEGDPEWHDVHGPRDPLSGEWADDMTLHRLSVECGLILDEKSPPGLEWIEAEHELAQAYEEAYRDAYTSAVLDIARGHVRNAALDEVRQWTAHRLASEADCGSPDMSESPGSRFLTNLRDSFCESVSGAFEDFKDDGYTLSQIFDRMEVDNAFSEMTDNAPDVYTSVLWAEFVDLAAYNEDPSEHTDDVSNMARLASCCLYMIAERLISAMRAAVQEAAGEPDE